MPRLAIVLLTVGALLHFVVLGLLARPASARPITGGDAAFLVGFGTAYLIAALAMARRRRWGRWLGIIVSGIESLPAVVLLYVILVYSADPGGSGSLELGSMAILLAPLIVFVAVWFDRLP